MYIQWQSENSEFLLTAEIFTWNAPWSKEKFSCLKKIFFREKNKSHVAENGIFNFQGQIRLKIRLFKNYFEVFLLSIRIFT